METRAATLENGVSEANKSVTNPPGVDHEAAEREKRRAAATMCVKLAHVWPTALIIVVMVLSFVVINHFSLLGSGGRETAEKMMIRLIAWPMIQSVGAGTVRTSAALMIGSQRAVKLQYLTLHMVRGGGGAL